MSTRVCWVTRQVVYLGAIERRARASGVGDREGVLGEGVQGATGIIEKLESLIPDVNNSRGDLQVLQSFDVDVGGRGLEGQARDGRDGDHKGDERNEGSTEDGREHRGEESEGG